MSENNKSNKSEFIIFYYIASIFIIMYINWMLLPVLAKPVINLSTQEEFEGYIDADEVIVVEILKDDILYTVKDSNGNTKHYKTQYSDVTELINRLRGKGIDIGVVELNKSDYFVVLLLILVVPIILVTYYGIKLNDKLKGNDKLADEEKDNNKTKDKETRNKKTFCDVAGQEEAKESLIEIVDYLSHPEKYNEIGAVCPKGILLVGPPGTGKTLLAKAVAGEANVPFIPVSGSEFVEMYVGRGASRVRDLFNKASKKAPCIVFIDEIDTVGKARGIGAGNNEEREQTLNQLLTEMDGFEENKGVVVLAATNRPEILDPALLRPGRFDRHVRVELPDMQGRVAILKVHAKKCKMEPDIDYNLIARATAGASGAQLANIVNEGALRAVRMGRNFVSHLDLEESVEVVLAGEQKKNQILSSEEKKIVSYHEIGHALLAAVQANSAPVHKITIIPRTSGALGYTMQIETRDKTLINRSETINKIAMFCAGRAAEELVFGECTTGASNDIEQATKIARAMVTRYGMTDEFDMMAMETGRGNYLGGNSQVICSPETAKEVDRAVLLIIKEAHLKAMKVLKENEQKLHELAEFLYQEETITGEQFMNILNRK
ncbi:MULTISPECIES: ATP-dependent zinc metalloprotease FtsH [unclassified Sedimentibacter]|uniref:ATP-dependent zinc metalloprotease FtsH n=1 Tax=unclassified Sedimentibacter TaxID=2649220 RepID=UPI0027DFAC94|nr:ATP-dependent zinc metalloprotease FtsH [Sedimentibacter sp. MB35-C1]WMJ76352.1 ATP-dependent zinc metalloprotease FtsH [Sedimentibacter sp. MB35-C1]